MKQSAVAYDEASLRLPLMELDHGACRWPVNDPEPKVEEYLFCGHKAKFGSRYCSHHAKRAVIPLERLRRPKPRASSRRRESSSAINCKRTVRPAASEGRPKRKGA